MNKKNVLVILLDLIFLIVFNTIYFSFDISLKLASSWISYGVIHFSYLMLILTPVIIKKYNKDYILGLPIYVVSAMYFMIELFIGSIIILFNPETIGFAIGIHMAISAGYFIVLITNILANDATNEAVLEQKQNIEFIKLNAAAIKSLNGVSSDENLNKTLDNLYYLIDSSQVKSDSSVYDIEQSIERHIKQLEAAVLNKDNETSMNLINSISLNIKKRNEQLKAKG